MANTPLPYFLLCCPNTLSGFRKTLRNVGRAWEWMGWGKGGRWNTHFNCVVFIFIILMWMQSSSQVMCVYVCVCWPWCSFSSLLCVERLCWASSCYSRGCAWDIWRGKAAWGRLWHPDISPCDLLKSVCAHCCCTLELSLKADGIVCEFSEFSPSSGEPRG